MNLWKAKLLTVCLSAVFSTVALPPILIFSSVEFHMPLWLHNMCLNNSLRNLLPANIAIFFLSHYSLETEGIAVYKKVTFKKLWLESTSAFVTSSIKKSLSEVDVRIM